MIAFGPAKTNVGYDFGGQNFANQRTFRAENMNAITGATPYPAFVVEPKSVENTNAAVSKNFPARQLIVIGNCKFPDVARPVGIV
jgi:hypothetical protein